MFPFGKIHVPGMKGTWNRTSELTAAFEYRSIENE